MKFSLADVYAFLLDACGEKYTITYAQPPTYLQSIIGREEMAGNKIVFVCLEERKGARCVSEVSPAKLVIKDAATENLELTGSPLKDDCVVDADISIELKMSNITPWKLEEEFHRGIDVDKARRIISNERFQLQNSAVESLNGAVWILCNGADAERTMLLQYEFAAKSASRGIITFAGLTPATSLTSIQPLQQKHFSFLRTNTPSETFVENVYQVKSNIMISCSWSTTVAIPALIDLTSCDVVLTQTFQLKDLGFLTHDLISQLRMLTRIREDIVYYKQFSEAENLAKEPFYRCGSGIENDDLAEGINKILTEVSGYVDNETGIELEHDIEAVIQISKSRQLTDVTDKLWNLLKCCSSYKELKTAFHLLFQMAVRCNVINTPTNKNRLAEIITEVSNRRLAIPCLTGTEPLELLLEIGLEKLYKDYEHIFVQSKLCSSNSLKEINTSGDGNVENGNAASTVRKSLRNAIRQEAVTPRKTLLHNINGGTRKPTSDEVLGFQNSYFDENDTAMRIAKLLHIHCTLEHLLMIQINLNLQNAFSGICEQLLSRPLKPYGKIDDSFNDTIEISIPAHYVREHLNGIEPHSRRISIKSKNKFRQLKTTFYYSLENICPPELSECIENTEKELTKECVYYSWVYQKIHTLK